MNGAEFERQVALWVAHMNMPRPNNELASLFCGVTPATEYHRKVNLQVSAEYSKAISPLYTGDGEKRLDYIRGSLRLSREKFAAGINDGSLHHAVLAQGAGLSDSFVSFPPWMFGAQDERTLEYTACVYEAMAKKSVVFHFVPAEFILVRSPMSTAPSLSLEGRLKQRMDIPYVIANIADNPAYHGMTLLNVSRKIDDDFPDNAGWEVHIFVEHHESEYQVFEPRRENSLTVAEVLQYGAAHPVAVRGKKIAALRSWHGGAVYDDRGTMKGSGSFLVVDFTNDVQTVIRTENINAVAGKDAVVLTYKAVVMPDLFVRYERPSVHIPVYSDDERRQQVERARKRKIAEARGM